MSKADTFNGVLARCPDRYLDDPAIAIVGSVYWERLFCSTWLPLARVDGVSAEVRALAWNAAWVITRQWGDELAGHVEATTVAGAHGQLATPMPAADGRPPAAPVGVRWLAPKNPKRTGNG